MQELFEKVPKLCVEDRVDDRVEGAVDVAEPRHHAHQPRWDVTVPTAGPQGVKDKEGGPAEQEGTCGKRRRSHRLKGSAAFRTSCWCSVPRSVFRRRSEFPGNSRLFKTCCSCVQKPADLQIRSAVDLSQNSSGVLAASLMKEIPQTKYPHADWMNRSGNWISD